MSSPEPRRCMMSISPGWTEICPILDSKSNYLLPYELCYHGPVIRATFTGDRAFRLSVYCYADNPLYTAVKLVENALGFYKLRNLVRNPSNAEPRTLSTQASMIYLRRLA
ncbi:hypothetical protein CEXT_494171 [Caerostris extrusa]|uniref:LAGLIDADG homing endonuclease n=1 Tax=Caerostris extrusa TaxID=172846 RepID=A0AAV4RQQ2_CAEEX|nr:hypothetical protein CEXT_494171 [Caerostris extrusa]